MLSIVQLSIWCISLISIAAILFRPWNLPEWVFAIGGAALILIFRLIALKAVIGAVKEGMDVYLFLTGMMVLSELARREKLFDWIAVFATKHAKGSSGRLFVLVYVAGILVTMCMSNDAAAVVLTPAVYAAVKKAGAKPLPFLFACAFIANAASFLLPISNPANLVVFASNMPGLGEWMRSFLIPSVAAIAVTFLGLRWWFKKDLDQRISSSGASEVKLEGAGHATALGLLLLVIVLLVSSALKIDLGLPTFLTALFVVAVVAFMKKTAPLPLLKDVSWGVIPLVAGLFVIVEATSQAGARELLDGFISWVGQFPESISGLLAGGILGLGTNVFNNLPLGLLAGKAVQAPQISTALRSSVLIGIDLGPNLSVTGSLATLLWLIVLRREGEKVSGASFLAVGVWLMPLSLAAALIALRI